MSGTQSISLYYNRLYFIGFIKLFYNQPVTVTSISMQSNNKDTHVSQVNSLNYFPPLHEFIMKDRKLSKEERMWKCHVSVI